jgi:hypothetical protein
MESHMNLNQNPITDKNDIRIPEKSDLYAALENILWFWPNLFIHACPLESGFKKKFNLTRAVRLTGQYQGLILIESYQELGFLLSRSLSNPSMAAGEDAFNEFVNMFCGHIMNKIRNSDRVAFRHFLPFELTPQDLPSRPPEAMMTVAIQEFPLNVQLWIDPAPPVEVGGLN